MLYTAQNFSVIEVLYLAVVPSAAGAVYHGARQAAKESLLQTNISDIFSFHFACSIRSTNAYLTSVLQKCDTKNVFFW